jgi:hypothetical protein
MTFRELRRSDLLDALFALEREEDINRVSRYFRCARIFRGQTTCAKILGGQTTCCSQRKKEVSSSSNRYAEFSSSVSRLTVVA